MIVMDRNIRSAVIRIYGFVRLTASVSCLSASSRISAKPVSIRCSIGEDMESPK